MLRLRRCSLHMLRFTAHRYSISTDTAQGISQHTVIALPLILLRAYQNLAYLDIFVDLSSTELGKIFIHSAAALIKIIPVNYLQFMHVTSNCTDLREKFMFVSVQCDLIKKYSVVAKREE